MLSTIFCVGTLALPHNLTEHFLAVPLDHNTPWTGRKLNLRYLLDTTHFKAEGPLVVYTGNEGNIEDFASSCGFLWVLAKRYGAAVILIEERYYGKSIPAPRAGEMPYAFLSSSQVIEDLAVALWKLRRQLNATKVVAVGGSYGGMLSAWLRKRHPDLVTAALAASAPVLGFASTLIEQHRASGFWDVTEAAYPCRETIGTAFRALWSAPKAAWERIGSDFGLCAHSQIRNATSLEALIGLLQQQLSDLAFANYPYPVGTLPANPTAYTCSKVHASAARVDAQQWGNAGAARDGDGWLPLVAALSWRMRPSGGGCVALRGAFAAAYTPGFLPGAWTFQRCTDLVMAFEVRNTSRMFLRCADGFHPNCAVEGQAALRRFCAAEFGVVVPDSAELQAVWGRNWTASTGGSRIVFSNGDLDPWNYGGVPDDVERAGDADSPLVLHIAGGAHHLDLREPNLADPPSVVLAREQEAVALGRWLGLSAPAPPPAPPGKPCTDRVTRIFHGDVCGGTVEAPGCATNECCKGAGIGNHCFCDICD